MDDKFISTKAFCIVTLFALLVGILLGRFSSNKINKSIETTSVVQTKNNVASLQIQQKTGKEIVKDIKTITIDKYYNKKGGLRKITVKKEQINTTDTNQTIAKIDSVNHHQEIKESNKTKTIEYKSDWLIGASMPLQLNKMPSWTHINITAGYKIFGDVYLTSTLQEFKIVSLGAQIVF